VLSGGIAHDFNNLLMAVMGNLELTCTKLSSDSPVRDLIERALQATNRAADLTRQMLAYSGRGTFVVEKVRVGDVGRSAPDSAGCEGHTFQRIRCSRYSPQPIARTSRRLYSKTYDLVKLREGLDKVLKPR